MEKSDLKYPLIHGQGRQVSEQPPPRIPQLLTAEAGVPLCLWLVSWGLLQGHRVFLPQPRVPEGHSPPLCFTVLLLGLLLSPHISLVPRLGYWEHWPSPGAWETISSESWTQTFNSSPSCSLSHR